MNEENNVKKYQIILADCPWKYKSWNKKQGSRTAESFYDTMSIKDLCKLPIKKIADNDCALFFWVTAPLLMECQDVIRSWGFKYKTIAFAWVKMDKKEEKPIIGLGSWTRGNIELCLLATKGSPKRIDKAVRQIVMAKREKHSKKPDEVRDRIITLLGDLPRIELFAREKIDGWDAWGNEIESDIDFNDIIYPKPENCCQLSLFDNDIEKLFAGYQNKS